VEEFFVKHDGFLHRMELGLKGSVCFIFAAYLALGFFVR